MKQVTVSDELYRQLKDFVVDPFEDTLQSVISRLINITNKARDRWPNLSDVDAPGLDEATETNDFQPRDESAAPSEELVAVSDFDSKELSEPSTL